MASSTFPRKEAEMAVFTFTGDPNSNGRGPAGEIFGVSYEPGVPFSVTDADQVAKFRSHSHFTETGGNANLGDFDGDSKPGGSVLAVGGLKAIHKGRGKYAITDGDKIIVEGLDKHDAETFNELSGEDRAKKVADFLANKGDQK